MADSVTRHLNAFHARKECFVEIVGGRLLKSGVTTIVAGRGNSLFVLPLSPVQAKSLQCPPGAEYSASRIDVSPRTLPPEIQLDVPKVENADHHRGGPIVGSVHYRVREKPRGDLALRRDVLSRIFGRWVSFTQPVAGLDPEGDFAIAATPPPAFRQPNLAVAFMELIEKRENAPDRVVSNTQAAIIITVE